MDVITQTLGGLCVASGIAGMCRCRPAQRVKIILMGAIGGAFPDLDTMTIWPSFDQTLGKWLGVENSVDLYFGHEWLSHQGFFHSLLGAILFTLLLWYVSGWLYAKGMRQAPSIPSAMGYLAPYFLAFSSAYVLHLIGDLFTPAGPWGGIRLFYPLDVYVGGLGTVWWWNNYDIVLILVLGLIINIGCLLTFSMLSTAGKYAPIAIFTSCVLLCGYQFSNRNFDFNQPGYTPREAASHHIQTQILAPDVYHFMVKVDHELPVYF